MIAISRSFSGSIALALAGDDMQQDRTIVIPRSRQHTNHFINVMPVKRTGIGDPEIIEHGRTVNEAGQAFLGDTSIARCLIRHEGTQLRQIFGQSTGRRRNRHVIVIENDHHAALLRPDIVETFEGHAGRHGAVTDNRHHLVVALHEITTSREAEPGRNRSGRMGRAKRIELAFRPRSEA